MGHEEVPHGFVLRTGDRCNIADGAGDHRRPAQPSMDHWEEPGEVSCGLPFFSPGGWNFWLAC